MVSIVEPDDGPHDGDTPIDRLQQYFKARGWAFERSGDEEIVATAGGSWAQYELRAVWRGEDGVLQFLALPDIRAAGDKRQAIYETLGLVNEQLWLGHFEMWAASGLILFRHAMLIDDDRDEPLGADAVETLVETAIDECERFYPVFQFVLWAGKTPQEAIAAALIDTQGEA
ncbi:MAG TPA: YbjN domain-containing protein [Sphingomonadaceae bacterium]|nr:YbjN domain-containing protein [Sphingomonadaceae bacterium]